MSCLKCGRETEENQVFCSRCLEDMEKNPVKPGIRIHLPDHSKDEQIRRPTRRKRQPTQEEQLAKLSKRLHRFRISFIVVVLILIVIIGCMSKALYDSFHDRLTGRNYTIETTGLSETSQVP